MGERAVIQRYTRLGLPSTFSRLRLLRCPFAHWHANFTPTLNLTTLTHTPEHKPPPHRSLPHSHFVCAKDVRGTLCHLAAGGGCQRPGTAPSPVSLSLPSPQDAQAQLTHCSELYPGP